MGLFPTCAGAMSGGLLDVSIFDCALRVSVALLLGALIGFERQWRQRMAGLRTNALVATGSCLFVLMTPLVGARENPLQIAAYVVSGIGFLAGGVIFKERLSVSGLNTAATLWCTAAIGSLVGLGFMSVAGIGVAAIMVANVVLRPVVQRISRQPLLTMQIATNCAIRAVCRQEIAERIRIMMIAAARDAALTLIAVSSDDIEGTGRVRVTTEVTIAAHFSARLERIVSRLGREAGVISVSWHVVPRAHGGREIPSQSSLAAVIVTDDSMCLEAVCTTATERRSALRRGRARLPRAMRTLPRRGAFQRNTPAAAASHADIGAIA